LYFVHDKEVVGVFVRFRAQLSMQKTIQHLNSYITQ
jgi:hypothetical protein